MDVAMMVTEGVTMTGGVLGAVVKQIIEHRHAAHENEVAQRAYGTAATMEALDKAWRAIALSPSHAIEYVPTLAHGVLPVVVSAPEPSLVCAYCGSSRWEEHSCWGCGHPKPR